MRVTFLDSTAASDPTGPRLEGAVQDLGHELEVVRRPGLAPPDSADLGYRLCDTWASSSALPDVVLAWGWVAGLAAQVAARECPVPVLLRLPRPGRSRDDRITRVERALVRAVTLVLASSPSEADALVNMGAPRSQVVVLPPMAPQRSSDSRIGVASDPEDIVIAVDDTAEEVEAVLAGMAAGRPAVVFDRGVLPDLVADGVSGVVVSARGDLTAAVQSLRSDGMGREAMGLAAADRVAACFSTDVVTAALGRVLVTADRRSLQPS